MRSIEKIRSRIIDREKLSSRLEQDRQEGRRIVFTNGCFDILHRGHIEYLSSASDLGDVFIIGLNTDESVRRIKGENRPAVDEDSRSLILASFDFVDYVVLFPEETASDLIAELRPDIWVKGGDYENIEELPEYKVVVENGGKVVVLPFIQGYSTTDIFNKILGIARNGS